jgi:hypothetical protein
MTPTLHGRDPLSRRLQPRSAHPFGPSNQERLNRLRRVVGVPTNRSRATALEAALRAVRALDLTGEVRRATARVAGRRLTADLVRGAVVAGYLNPDLRSLTVIFPESGLVASENESFLLTTAN